MSFKVKPFDQYFRIYEEINNKLFTIIPEGSTVKNRFKLPTRRGRYSKSWKKKLW